MQFDLLDACEKAKKDGKIGHIGFSFHDELDVFEKIVSYYNGWEFLMIQLNYLNENYQAGINGLKMAHEKGIGVVIMEPLFVGRLANIKEEAKAPFEKINDKKPVQWALDYLWDKDEVSLVISGMSDISQVENNIQLANESKINKLTNDEKQAIKEVEKIILNSGAINCTSCSYCMPCPHGVDICENFRIYNRPVS